MAQGETICHSCKTNHVQGTTSPGIFNYLAKKHRWLGKIDTSPISVSHLVQQAALCKTSTPPRGPGKWILGQYGALRCSDRCSDSDAIQLDIRWEG